MIDYSLACKAAHVVVLCVQYTKQCCWCNAEMKTNDSPLDR